MPIVQELPKDIKYTKYSPLFTRVTNVADARLFKQDLHKAIDEIQIARPQRGGIQVRMSDVFFSDDYGYASLLSGYKRARARGVEFILEAPTAKVLEKLNQLGFVEFMTVVAP